MAATDLKQGLAGGSGGSASRSGTDYCYRDRAAGSWGLGDLGSGFRRSCGACAKLVAKRLGVVEVEVSISAGVVSATQTRQATHAQGSKNRKPLRISSRARGKRGNDNRLRSRRRGICRRQVEFAWKLSTKPLFSTRSWTDSRRLRAIQVSFHRVHLQSPPHRRHRDDQSGATVVDEKGMAAIKTTNETTWPIQLLLEGEAGRPSNGPP